MRARPAPPGRPQCARACAVRTLPLGLRVPGRGSSWGTVCVCLRLAGGSSRASRSDLFSLNSGHSFLSRAQLTFVCPERGRNSFLISVRAQLRPQCAPIPRVCACACARARVCADGVKGLMDDVEELRSHRKNMCLSTSVKHFAL